MIRFVSKTSVCPLKGDSLFLHLSFLKRITFQKWWVLFTIIILLEVFFNSDEKNILYDQSSLAFFEIALLAHWLFWRDLQRCCIPRFRNKNLNTRMNLNRKPITGLWSLWTKTFHNIFMKINPWLTSQNSNRTYFTKIVSFNCYRIRTTYSRVTICILLLQFFIQTLSMPKLFYISCFSFLLLH